MKLKLPSIFFVLAFTINIPVFAQDNSAEITETEEFQVLTISGIISEEDDSMDEVLVELFEQNKLVDAMETKKNGKFKFSLYNNHIYTLQFSKGGYVTKKVTVNTTVPADFEEEVDYPFDCSLEKQNPTFTPKVQNLNEYPVAIIQFDENKKAFAFDKGYTSSLKQELKDAEN